MFSPKMTLALAKKLLSREMLSVAPRLVLRPQAILLGRSLVGALAQGCRITPARLSRLASLTYL